MDISVRYSYTDYYQALALGAQYSKWRWLVSIFGLLLIFSMVWAILTSGTYTPIDVLFILLAISFLFYKQLLLRFAAFIRFRQSTHLRKIYHLHIDSKGVKVKSEGESGQFEWKVLSKIIYGNNMVILFRSPLIMNMIPKRCFASEKAWIELVKLIQKETPTTSAHHQY